MLYGPYNCSDGRARVIHNGKTKLYARYLLEQELGRELTNKEQVHHRDEDYRNDVISNLEVREISEHISSHSKVYFDIQVECVECKKKYWITGEQHKNRVNNIKAGKTRGPFCSKFCLGKYSRRNFWTGKDKKP